MGDNMFRWIVGRFLDTGYHAAVIVVILLVVRWVLLKLHFPRRYMCYLWLIPLIRLLFPGTAPFSFGVIPENMSPVPVDMDRVLEYPLLHTQAVSIAISKAPAWTDAHLIQTFISRFAGVWLLGVCGITGYSLISYVLLNRKLRSVVKTDEEGVYMADGICTAFVLGLWRTRIYLPSGLSEDVWEYVLKHEKMHIRRKDPWLKFAAYMATVVYWCNPFVWLMYGMLVKDIEAGCDEAVICERPVEYRKAYSKALLLTAIGNWKSGLNPLAFSEGNPRKRIKWIACYREPAAAALLLGIAACFMTGCGLLFFKPGTTEMPVDYGRSDLYSQQDMDEAIAIIQKEFSDWGMGFELHSIRYTTDDDCISAVRLQSENEDSEGKLYSQMIQFYIDFHTPIDSNKAGGFAPDREYTNYNWWLGRMDGGAWETLTWGGG